MEKGYLERMVFEAFQSKVLGMALSPEHQSAVFGLLDMIETGEVSVVQGSEDGWKVNETAKMAIVLAFPLLPNVIMGPDGIWRDKVPLRNDWEQVGIRCVPGGYARRYTFIGPNVIIMNGGFVNVGAQVHEGTMVDSGALVGSCAYIGKGVHLSAGVVIGGVLEPPQALPVVIEDGAFIGACCSVVEGVVVGESAVLAPGTHIAKNTPIVNRLEDGEIIRGVIPPGAVVMMGIHPVNGLVCPQIVKYRDEKTSAATVLNDFLRD